MKEKIKRWKGGSEKTSTCTELDDSEVLEVCMARRTLEMAHLAALYFTPSRRCHLHTLYQMMMDGENQCHCDEHFIKVTLPSKLLKTSLSQPCCQNINLSTLPVYSKGRGNVNLSAGTAKIGWSTGIILTPQPMFSATSLDVLTGLIPCSTFLL